MDPLANMLTIIKNGYMAKKPNVVIPLSKFKLEVVRVLEKEGLVGKITTTEKTIETELLYDGQKPKLTEIKKVSKPGLRIYTRSKAIKKVKGGIGITIVTTSKGVMTGKDAREQKLGGEVICRAW